MTDEPLIDVCDKVNLMQYREKRGEWLYLLNNDEHHAIWKQIMAMIWDDLSFHILNKSRKPNSSATNPLLANFIDRGYILGQVIALRKLVENNPKKPEKGVISLRRLLADLCKNIGLLTREIYVSHDGLPYDYEAVERQWWEQHLGQISNGNHTIMSYIPTTGSGAFNMSKRSHEQFDKLSGVRPENRSRTDCISASVFCTLNRWIEDSGAEAIIKMGNKFLAHAADSVSRASVSIKMEGISINKIAAAHRTFVRNA